MIDWHPIENDDDIPKGRLLLVFAPAVEDFGDLVCLAEWHPSAGLCIDEIRTATHWAEFNRPDDRAMRDHEELIRQKDAELAERLASKGARP